MYRKRESRGALFARSGSLFRHQEIRNVGTWVVTTSCQIRPLWSSLSLADDAKLLQLVDCLNWRIQSEIDNILNLKPGLCNCQCDYLAGLLGFLLSGFKMRLPFVIFSNSNFWLRHLQER